MDRTTVSTLSQEIIISFQSQLQGKITQPGDPNYDEARAVWNGMIDRYPTLIIHCERVEDVVASVNFAREHNLKVAVRGGGHNVAGHATCDDGLVIDLGPMNKVEVDPENKVARAQGGATLGDLDAATQIHGLATPAGVFSDTGIAGLTLGGGFGWLRNKYGLTCDNLIGAEVVTAEGQIIYASETQNFDLLWGLRGGGGNFGIVTTFEYQLHPVGPEIMFAFVLHDGTNADQMKKAVKFYRDFSQSASDEISTILALGQIPPEEHFPENLHGTPFILFGAMYAGDPKVGETALQPLIDFDKPLINLSGVMPYVEAQKMFDADYPDGRRYYWKSLNLTHLDEEAIAHIVEHARQQPSPFSTTDLWQIGGAIRRVSAEQSAFFGRDISFVLNPEANWENAQDDEINIAWVRNMIDGMGKYTDGSRYLNFPGFQEEGDDMMKKAFGPQYKRLADLKKKYDPSNFFSLNQNIKPEA